MLHVIHTGHGFVINVSSKESKKLFQELVQRATNLWPDAPPIVKEFADEITADWNNNRPLQNYQEQDTSVTRTKRRGINCGYCNHVNLVDIPKGVTLVTTLVTYSCSECGKVNEATPLGEQA